MGKSKPRVDAALAARRVDDVLRLILDGAQYWDLRQYVAEKESEADSCWFKQQDRESISERQLRRYMSQANQLIQGSQERSRKKLMRRHLAQRRSLYARAVTTGELRTALSCLEDEAKLIGLYAPQKIAPTTPDGKKEYSGGMTDEERLAALERLHARMGKTSGRATLNGTGNSH